MQRVRQELTKGHTVMNVKTLTRVVFSLAVMATGAAVASAAEKADAEQIGETIRQLIAHAIKHFNDLDSEIIQEFEDYPSEV